MLRYMANVFPNVLIPHVSVNAFHVQSFLFTLVTSVIGDVHDDVAADIVGRHRAV